MLLSVEPPLKRPLQVATDCSGMESPILALKDLGIDHGHVFSSDTCKCSRKVSRLVSRPMKSYKNIIHRDNGTTDGCDLYVAGPPCQPYSRAGKKRGAKDKRSCLLYFVLDYIVQTRPRVAVLEQVPQFKTWRKFRKLSYFCLTGFN